MQIPKIIHYFYDDVNPWAKGKNPQFRMCLYSWKKACPDYALMLWHEKSPEFGQILQQSLFVRKAYELKLWAFVSDYVRLYVLNKYGGIYVDTDVQLLQNFDKFLDDGFFVSIESDIHRQENVPEPAVMGSTPGHPLIAETMKLYQSEQVFEIKKPMIPLVMKKVLAEMSGFARVPYDSSQLALRSESYYLNNRRIDDYEVYLGQQCYRDARRQISVYPCRYFCPSWCVFGEKAVTAETVAIHWNQSSWWQADAFARLHNSILPPPPPPAPVPPSMPPRRYLSYGLFKLPLLKICHMPPETKVSCLGLLTVRKSPRYFKLSLVGGLTLFKIVRRD